MSNVNYDQEFEKPLRELRCLECRAKLADEYIHRGRLAIKCWRCKVMNRFVFRDHRDKQVAIIKTAPKVRNIKK